MALNQRAHYRRYLHFAAILCLSAAALAMPRFCLGTARVEVYQATVPLAERSEGAQAAAFQAALKIVLVKATGRRSADEEAVFAPLRANARRYVQQFRSAPDHKLWVAFDGTALEHWLIRSGLPLWSADRPSTLMWLTVQNGTQGTLVSADDMSELKSAIDAAAQLRGIPLVWPGADAAGSGAAAADIAHRVGAEAILTGRATGTVSTASVRWTLQFQDQSSEMSGVVEGVNHAADLYAGLYAANGALAPVDIDVTGVGGLQDYAGIESYLDSLTFITHVGVEALSGDTVRFRLTMRGGIEALQRALALSGRLESIAKGDSGIERFQLRH